jgi:hypothetical protein
MNEQPRATHTSWERHARAHAYSAQGERALQQAVTKPHTIARGRQFGATSM